MEPKTAAPTATWGPTAAGPGTVAPPPGPAEMKWDVGPAVAPPPFAPSEPAYTAPPSAPSGPAYTPPPPAPPAPEEEWVPAAVQPAETLAPSWQPVSTPLRAVAGASL